MISIDQVDEQPIMETIYFSEISDSRVRITAGNRLSTLWEIIVDLESSNGGTSGTVYVDRADVAKWKGNVLKIIPEMHARLSAAGATFTNWDYMDVFHT